MMLQVDVWRSYQEGVCGLGEVGAEMTSPKIAAVHVAEAAEPCATIGQPSLLNTSLVSPKTNYSSKNAETLLYKTLLNSH
jgi:hypothetical protein